MTKVKKQATKVLPKYNPSSVLITDHRGYTMKVRKTNKGNRYTIGCHVNWSAKRCLEHWQPERYGWRVAGYTGTWEAPRKEVRLRAEGFHNAVRDFEAGIGVYKRGDPIVLRQPSYAISKADMTDVTFDVGVTTLKLTNCKINMSQIPDGLKLLTLNKCEIVGDIELPLGCDFEWYS